MGISAGFYVPAIIDLLGDYFPEKQRTKAMSLLGVGILVGMGSNQMTINLITLMGWRNF